ncbi:MAG: SPOR domain-containing protein [Bacteroidota bacterium]
MKQVLSWITGVWLVAGALFAQGPQSTYYKYEREDVSAYRQKVTFQLPEIPANVVVAEVPPYASVERYFTPGQKYYIQANSRLEQFVKKHIELGGKRTTTEGYRIQIFAGSSRENAQKIKGEFLALFPGYSNYLLYISPTYRVRVGDFLSKGDAQMFNSRLKQYFPGAFVVKDEVKIPRFKNQQYIEERERN